MGDLSVAACMHEGVVSCAPDTTLDEVAATMRGANVSAIVVVERGVVAGLISRTDLVNVAFVQPYLRYWRGMAARHVMSAPIVSVRPQALLGEALELLRARRIHRLVVTETGPAGERPVGILSLSDVLRMLGERKDEDGP